MKTMSDYSIFCTEAQTRKALELGAPIEVREFIGGELDDDWCYDISTNYVCEIPTAEQMIGWLEEQGNISSISIETSENEIAWQWIIYFNDKSWLPWDAICNSRREATIAAIDAALEHLLNNEQ